MKKATKLVTKLKRNKIWNTSTKFIEKHKNKRYGKDN